MASWLNPRHKPVLGGFSAGANAALAAVNAAPDLFSGLFLYEGTFYSEDDRVIEHNVQNCQLLEEALLSGVVYDAGAAVFGAAIGLADADPEGLSPLVGFPPGTTNQEALLFIFSAPPAPGALAPTPDFVRLIGNFETQEFVYSDQDRLALAGPLFDNYASVPALRDLACGLAGVDQSHYANLSQFPGDVLMFVGGTGFGQSMLDTASLLSGANSISVNLRPELGEADAYFHHDWEHAFQRPLERWLRQQQHGGTRAVKHSYYSRAP
jgi:hypothetical protein